MKAAIIEKYGQEKLSITNIEKPYYFENQVLVEVYAASLNPIDSKIKSGNLKSLLPYKMPLIMGNDFSGKVVAVGSKVKNLSIGDKVYGRPRKSNIGTFAEFIAIDQQDLALMPKNLTFEEAASLPLVALTSLQALSDTLHLKKGQRVLIQAGAGGVGTVAIQIAKAMGLFVATTVSEKGYSLVKKLGADQIIDYKKQDFERVLSDIDAVFDTLGNTAVSKAFKIVKKGGGIVSITANPNLNFYKTYKTDYHLTPLHGVILFFMGLKFDFLSFLYKVSYTQLFMKPSHSQLLTIKEMVEAGKIIPVIDSIFTLKDINKAFKKLEDGHAKGKIIIQIKEEI